MRSFLRSGRFIFLSVSGVMNSSFFPAGTRLPRVYLPQKHPDKRAARRRSGERHARNEKQRDGEIFAKSRGTK